MRILALYPNAEGYSRVPTGMALVVSSLLQAGHELTVFDTTFMTKSNVDNDIREKASLVKRTEIDYSYDSLGKDEILSRFKDAITTFNPDLLMVTLIEDNYRFAHFLMEGAKAVKSSLVIIVGGPTPSAVPEIIIENPCIDYLVQGEGAAAAVEFCQFFADEEKRKTIQNLWYTENGEIKHNKPRSFVDMNTIPFQDFSLWDRRHLLKPYDGSVYITGYVETSRGCPNRCTYCINHAIRKSLSHCGRYFRQKKLAPVIEEVELQKKTWDIERVVFCDDNFLLRGDEEMEEFAERWNDVIALPFWITTSAEYITSSKLLSLKKAGCDGIGLGVESGNEWFRKNMLLRNVSNQKLIETFSLIHEFGIRTTANFMIGFPGEHEADVFETIKLMKKLQPKSYDVSFVSPYVGTRIHALARELGAIEIDDAPGFCGMARNVSFRGKPTVKNPHMTEERLMQIYDDIMKYVTGEYSIPEEFSSSAPGADAMAPPREGLSKTEADFISSLSR